HAPCRLHHVPNCHSDADLAQLRPRTGFAILAPFSRILENDTCIRVLATYKFLPSVSGNSADGVALACLTLCTASGSRILRSISGPASPLLHRRAANPNDWSSR